jgi:hypothetical protein
MSYTSTSQGADANPAATFMTALNTILVAAGFTNVESWTSSTFTAIIYKSPAASNTFGSDWYLVVSRTSDADTNVSFTVAEVWDTGTKKVRNYAATATTRTPTGSYAINDATGLAPNSGTLFIATVGLSAAGFQYWVSATCDRVVVATRVSTTDSGIYAGLYDDLLPIAGSPFPLLVGNLNSGNNNSSTREPYTTTSTSNAFIVNFPLTNCYWGPVSIGVDIYQGKYVTARVVVHSSRATASNMTGVRGLLKDVINANVAAAVNGDTLAVTDALGATRNYTRVGSGTTVGLYWADQGV